MRNEKCELAPLHEAVNEGLCATQFFSFIDSVAEVNVSLGGTAYLDIYTRIYNCSWSEMNLVIQRADGETERYSNSMSVTGDGRGSFSYISGRWLRIRGYCGYHGLRWCDMLIDISPTDFQYDGAQISGGIYLSECFSTTSITLNIQGRTITQMVYSGASK